MENPYFIKQKIGSNGEDLSLVQDENITKVTYSHGTTMEQIIVNKKGKVLDSLVGKMNSEGIELFHVDYVPENLKKYEREVKHLKTIQKHLINVYEKEYETFLENQKIQEEYRNNKLNRRDNNYEQNILPISDEQRKCSSELMKKYEQNNAEQVIQEPELNTYTVN
jgi:hypothetical protein